jgi:hypothetical protein
LLIITAVLGMIALMTHTKKNRAPSPDFKSSPVSVVIHADAGPEAAAGSAGPIGRPSIEIAPLDDDGDTIIDESAEKDKADSPRNSAAGNAAIVTAIMGGLTGLMGAMTQTMVAFLKMRDRRRPRSGEEESGAEPPSDQEQS